MKNKTDSNNLQTYVKSLILDKNLYLANNTNLIKNLVHAIANERIINVNGATGTGKSYIVNNIIVPLVKKEYTVQRFNHTNLISSELEGCLSISDNRIVIVSDQKIKPNQDSYSDSDTIDGLLRVVDDGYDIYLQSLQEQFLDYPSIVEKIINDIHNITMDQIQVSLVGYLESIISGIKSNYSGLRNIIKSENIAEWRELLELYSPNVKFMLTFSSYLDKKRLRENIWDSIYQGPRAVDLSEISDFNEKFRKTWSMIIADTGLAPGRKHTKAVDLMRLKKYCESLLNKFTYNELNEESIDTLLKPLIDKIDKLQSGENSYETTIETIYVFTKLELKNSSTSIIQFDTLEFEEYRNKYNRLRIIVNLLGDSVKPLEITLKPRAATFILFLAIERKNKGKDWLRDPHQHIDVLSELVSRLELSPDLIVDDTIMATQPISWIHDIKNKIRRKIVDEINDDISIGMNSEAHLFKINQEQSGTNGIYSLINSIKHIKLPW